MIDFRIRRGLYEDLFIEPGVPDPNVIIEKGSWYLCTDTAELFLGCEVFDEETQEDKLTLKKINGDHNNAADIPTHSPTVGEDGKYIIDIVVEEAEDGSERIRVIFSDETELVLGAVSGIPGKDGETVSIKIGDVTYEHVNGVIELPEVDLQDYAKKKDIPTNISDLFDDSNFITAEDIPEVDLSEYAKTTDIPTKVSELENDTGYLTEHQSLEEYAKKSDIPNAIDLSGYALKKDIPDVSDFISEIPDEYVT